MSLQDFIFSEKRSDRIKQHLLFWAIWYIYIIPTHAGAPLGSPEKATFQNILNTLSESVFTVFTQLPTVYIMLYFVFPKFILKKKYLLSALLIVILGLLTFALNFFVQAKVMQPFIAWLLPDNQIPKTPRPAGFAFFSAVMGVNKAAFTITASALMLKFAKHWYHKEHRNLQLQKENSEAQLQLLTAQVHPHFLFNTLNNIYSQAQTESPKSSKMIMGLSDMLRYILYEGQKQLVPLKQELTLIAEYINLEKIRYGNKLDAHVLTPDKPGDLYIAPLLLLPFVENCFRQDPGNVLQTPWINLTIALKNTTLVMKLMNGKPTAHEKEYDNTDIGISNVRQRLELLYKDKYELQEREDEEVFVVDLEIKLVRIENKEDYAGVQPPDQPLAFIV
ncbi:MAG TPA: sensor histidine kinase [Chitinophagaceae bacterium]